MSSGLVGRWLVRAELDEGGALRDLRVTGGTEAWLERLLRSTRVLLQGGTFVLPAGAAGGGTHRLGLEVWVEELGEATDGPPRLVRELASRYPEGKEPGEASVTYNSGRRVRLRVHVDPTW